MTSDAHEMSIVCLFREELLKLVGGKEVSEPYRALLKRLIRQVRVTRDYLQAQLDKKLFEVPHDVELIEFSRQLQEPLEVCYRSLCENNLHLIANGILLDTLRRLACFGVTLTKLDLRQESSRHSEAFEEILKHIQQDEQTYLEWAEEKKQAFLLEELVSKRPLISHQHPWSVETKEVLDTFEIIGRKSSQEALGAYIISMAGQPSDVLLVALFMKEMAQGQTLPVSNYCWWNARSSMMTSFRLFPCSKLWMISIVREMWLIDCCPLKATGIWSTINKKWWLDTLIQRKMPGNLISFCRGAPFNIKQLISWVLF